MQPFRPDRRISRAETPTSSAAARRRRRTRGQALVEFALVLPIFVLLVAGMLDFGFALYSRMTVINAAREGARAAVMAPDPAAIPALVPSTVQSAANGLAVVVPPPTCIRVPTGTCDFNATANSKPGDFVKVSVTYTYHTFFPFLFGATFDLGTSVQMVVE